MITVTVGTRRNSYVSFTSKGHADYAPEGQDIVCAAVSALIVNTVNSIEKFTKDQMEVREKDGFVSFRFVKPISEKGTLLMDSLVLGLTKIEHDYQNRYLTVRVREV